MKLGKKFYAALVMLGLIGQIAWVVENMYLNVFIYKMFNASAGDISLMVALSAVTATATTLLMGALSDRMGKRKVLVCGGYIVWGVSILLAFLLSSYTALPIVAVFGIVNAAELVKAGIGTVLVARGRWARRLDTGA